MKVLGGIAFAFALALALPALAATDVRAFEAKGDGVTKDTAAVQRAIDACAAGGGGTVDFPAGTYLCGTLHLRSNVTLRLEAGASLLGSRDIGDYGPPEKLGFKNDADQETSFFHFALLAGEDVEHVAIVGEGTIDANFTHRHGPKPIALKRCRFVRIAGITILNAPNYNISMLGTDFVVIDGVTILNGYADGIDPDSCQNVCIANCHIESSDDAIVPKSSFSLGEHRSCESITVTNCYLSSDANCFKLGTESGGDFKRIAVSNCVMCGLAGRGPASSGVALESVDGANVDGVVVSNITMHDVESPIFIRLGNRGRDRAPAAGTLRNVSISDVVADRVWFTSIIAGIPDHPVEGVTLSNVRIVCAGGMPARPAAEPVPEQIKSYPTPGMFGLLPTYGLYCRHVTGLTLSNVQLLAKEPFWRFTVTDGRKIDWNAPTPGPSQVSPLGPAVVCDDVAGLRIDGLDALASSDGSPVVRFRDVRDALVRGCVGPAGAKTLVSVSGNMTRGISLRGNALGEAAVALSPDVRRGAVSLDRGRLVKASPQKEQER